MERFQVNSRMELRTLRFVRGSVDARKLVPVVILALLTILIQRTEAQLPLPQSPNAFQPTPWRSNFLQPPAPAAASPYTGRIGPQPGSFAQFHRQTEILGPQGRVETIVTPSDFDGNLTEDMIKSAYVIDDKRFIDSHPTRCFVSTKVEDPSSLEPQFVIIGPGLENRIPASANLDRIRQAGFDPNKRTQIFVHGFTQSYPDTEWLRKVRSLYELNQQLFFNNLIFMDWGRAAGQSFARAAADTVLMGSYLAEFVQKLIEVGANRYEIHLIGHSLGAHVSGFAGKRIRPRIGRITGLDAAGPCFGKVTSNGAHDKLGPEDAFQVDVFHYDDEFLGLPGQHGQFDVYVNSGSAQPGCKGNINSMLNAAITLALGRDRVLSESHTRSTEVAVEQLSLRGCQNVAYECRDYGTFMAGECGKCDDQNNQCFLTSFEFQYLANSSLVRSSLNTNPQRRLRTSFPGKRFYIATGSQLNLFCLEHYQIVIKFEPTQEFKSATKASKWQFPLLLITDRGDPLNCTVTNQMGANVFSHLLLVEWPLQRIIGAEIEAQDSHGKQMTQIVPAAQFKSRPFELGGSPFKLLQIEINYMSSMDPNVRRAKSSNLCVLPPKPPRANMMPRDHMNEYVRSARQLNTAAEPLVLGECKGPPGSLV